MGNTTPSPPPLPPPPPSSSPSKSAEILEERTGTAVLLNIPTKIRKSDVETYIQKHVEDLVPRGNLDEYNPKIFISYATGNRSGKDEDGCGPGMYYTKALVDCFDNLGYDTFTGLHIGPFVNWKMHYIGKLNNNVADVLIVVLAPAFFRSLPCLEEVYTAKIRGVNILPVSFEHPWVDTDEPWEEATTQEQLNMKDIVIPAIMETNSHPKPPSTVLQNPAEDLMMIFKKVNEIIQRTPYFHRRKSPPPRLLSSSDESESDDTESSFKPPFKIIAINLRRAPERVKTNRAWTDYLNDEKDELRLNLQKIHKLSSSSKVLIDPFRDSSSGHQRAVVKLDYRVRIKSQLCKDDYDDINYYLGNIRDILFEGLQNVGLDEKEAICILNKMRVYGAWESSINVCFKAPEQAMSVLYSLIYESDMGLNVGMTRDGQPVHAVSLNPLFEVLPQNKQATSAFFDLFSASVQEKQDGNCVDLLVSDESDRNIGIFLPTSSEAASTFFDQGSIKLSTSLAPINLCHGDNILLGDDSLTGPKATTVVQNTAIALMSKSFTMQNNNDNNPMTNSKTERNYSLWLLPPLNSSECIQPQIAKLAEKYGGPFFVPHITVVGGIKCKSEQEALEVARNLQEGLAGFGTVTCEFRNTPYSSQGTKWSQALCLEMVLSESLLNLCHSSLRIIGRDPDQWTFPSPICAPHLSLFYGTSNIPHTVEVQPVESFQSSVIALWQTEPPTTEGVAKWKEIIRIELESTKEKGEFDDMRGGLSSESSSKVTQNRRSNLDMFINDATAADGDQRLKKLEEAVERLLDEKEILQNEVDKARDRIENQQQIIDERGKCIEKQDDIIRGLRNDLSRIEKAHKEEQAFNQELIIKLQKEKEKLSRKLDETSVHERLPPDGTTTAPSSPSLSKLDKNPESKPLASVRPDALGDTSSETIGGQQKHTRENFMGMSFDTSQLGEPDELQRYNDSRLARLVQGSRESMETTIDVMNDPTPDTTPDMKQTNMIYPLF